MDRCPVIALVAFIAGAVFGMFMVGLAADYRAANRGWLYHAGQMYVVTPAKPVATP